MAETKAGPLNVVPFAGLLQSKDILFAFGVVSIVIMMVVPLPSFILNLFLTLNIALALTILLVSIYNQYALQFSAFPSLLLIATLFRLSLNVSTTRIILSGQGATIDIIKAFGNFVVGGNYVVGFVVFIILVLIQFIVIAKGAERVAEVAARFTLDAMPIKGMAIDADLNAGSIDQDEATKRRLDLQREADFYGAMDGASKFVKNDAIAGIIITVINLLGGLVIGIFQRGETAMDALQAYALFTVGDGLVSQIPALLIATATGIVVTRASSDSSLGHDISGQLLSHPKVLGIGSGLMAFLGLIPGLPKLSFLILSAILGTLAYLTHRDEEEASKKDIEEKMAEEQTAASGPEDVSSLLTVDPLELEIGYNLIPLVDANQGGDLLNRITLIRRQIAIDLGLVVPPIRIRDNIQLPPSCYVFKIKGVEFAQYEIIPDQFMAMNPGTATSKISGIEVEEPAFGLPAVWIQSSLRERAEMAGYTVVDPSTVIATHLTEVIRKNAHEILGRQELQQLLDTVKENYPLILDEVVPNVVSQSSLLKILQNLLKENVSIRHMVNILESLSDCKGIGEIDTLTEIARQGLSRHICKSLMDETGVIKVISLDPQLEQMLANALQKIDGSVQLGIDPTSASKLLEKIRNKIEEVMQDGHSPILLCNSALRLSLKRLTERIAPRLTVLSYQEIPTSVRLESVGLISLQG
ncbi:MAG: flagellar biosynthesis protein FlhA [Clostridiales bacterium]|nr:flagellar biosynthesis protein FlhA [Clostridiales bacterium]MDN5281357.1 flagellar biosynthesis protein FlhA [Candidatus Ozemobacter sp.]